jgi:hypothetical protein
MITNVVEENDNFKSELKAAFDEINKLEIDNIKKKQIIFSLREQCEAFKVSS